MNINPVGPLSPLDVTKIQPSVKGQNSAQQIGQTFQDALDSLGQSQNGSDDLLQKLAAGEDVDIHQVTIAAEETDVNFRIAMAIRDRLVDSYREVMRMAV